MTSQRHSRVKELFLAVIKLPPAQRGLWLQEKCADDASLLREVEALLAQQSAEPCGPDSSFGAPNDNSKPPESSMKLDALIAPELPPGKMIAERYRIVSRLGEGGMGIVYRAEDLNLTQDVAIKFLPAVVAKSPAWLARFRNEARLARTVTHPNVCRVHDIGEADGETFITMEFVAGENLSSLQKRIGRPTVEKGVDIARQICAGLSAAHRAGVLHRDLKPANIILDTEGNVRITDFGIAGLTGQIAAGEICAGTPAYMAPEQITGREVTAKSDLYSLGLVLYELFSGCQAFRATTINEYIQLQENESPPPLSELVDNLPASIEGTINECLAKAPDERPPSALHVAAALPGTDVLHLALASGVTPSPDLVAAAPASKSRSRNSWTFPLVGFLLLTSMVILRSMYPLQWDDLGSTRPVALAERAGRVLELSGMAIPNAYEKFGYHETESAWRAMVRSYGVRDFADGALPSNPNEPVFFYRQSDRPIVSGAVENVFWHSGYVSPWDPPLTGTNSRSVLIDKTGRLILLGAASGSSTNKSSPMDFNSLLDAAGLKSDRLVPNARDQKLAGGIEECTAFDVSDAPEPEEARTVAVGCSSPQVPLFFAVGLQRDKQQLAAAEESIDGVSFQHRIVLLAQRVLFLFLLAAAVPFAIMRSRITRADYQIAVRLALVVVLLEIAAAVLRLESSGTFFELVSRLSMAAVRAFGVAGLIGVFYLAVDYYARRVWPHLLVTWNRLFLSRFEDPELRFHTLVGICTGCWWALTTAAERAFVTASGWTARPMFTGDRIAEKLHGFPAALASFLGCAEQALVLGVLFLLLLVAVRTWVRVPALAAALCALVLACAVVPRGANPYTAWLALGVGGTLVGAWVMVRYGLLAIVVATFVAFVLNTTPLNVRPSAWTAGLSISAILIVICLSIYGAARFRTPSAA